MSAKRGAYWVNKGREGWRYEGHGWGSYGVKRTANGWYAFLDPFGGDPIGFGMYVTRQEAQRKIESIVGALVESKAARKGNPRGGVMKFKSLSVGELFTFAREHDKKYDASGIPTGPWRKTSARGYAHALQGGKYQVGTTGVEVVGSEARGKNPRRTRKARATRAKSLSYGHKLWRKGMYETTKRKRATNPAAKIYIVFRLRGKYDLYFLALDGGHVRWTLTRGETVQWQDKQRALKVATYLARKDKSGAQYGVTRKGSDNSAIYNAVARKSPGKAAARGDETPSGLRKAN